MWRIRRLYANKRNSYLGREASITDGTLEGTLLGVAPVVDLKGRVAGKRLVADGTRSVAAHCIQTNPLFIATIKLRIRTQNTQQGLVGRGSCYLNV